MAMKNSASARYEGFGKDGKGYVSMQSGAMTDQPYGFNTRFDDAPGTNPEEQIAAAHASCFTMALSMAKQGIKDGQLETTSLVTLEKDGDGFKVVSSALTLSADIEEMGSERFQALAMDAKANCPISKLLNCEISLDIKALSHVRRLWLAQRDVAADNPPMSVRRGNAVTSI